MGRDDAENGESGLREERRREGRRREGRRGEKPAQPMPQNADRHGRARVGSCHLECIFRMHKGEWVHREIIDATPTPTLSTCEFGKFSHVDGVGVGVASIKAQGAPV